MVNVAFGCVFESIPMIHRLYLRRMSIEAYNTSCKTNTQSNLMNLPTLSLDFDPATGVMPDFEGSKRWLNQLDVCFADEAAHQAMLSQGDQVLYSLTNIDTAKGEGQLHDGLGILQPGKVGNEYFMTRGHLHAWRPAAEVYICLQG